MPGRRSRGTRPAAGAVVALLRLSTALAAQAAPLKCDGSEFRQFDFWIGNWDVTARGQQAGTNLVTLEEDGCVVHEHWKGSRGGTGQSFNFYDRGDRKWHQVWIANDGSALFLTGGLVGNTLTLEGETPQPDGSTVRNRISFRNNPDHTVRQLWETSADGGTTWTPAFDGLYRKRKG
jgi:hypothetical protein